MNDLRQAAQQALEALEAMQSYAAAERKGLRICDEAIAALHAALAEPDSDYERGFVDGMNLQTKRSVDKAVNRIAEPEQEPVCDKDPGGCWNVRCQLGKVCKNTAPTPRKPLTDEEIDDLSRTMVKGDRSVNWLCRAIERAHGITGDQT